MEAKITLHKKGITPEEVTAWADHHLNLDPQDRVISGVVMESHSFGYGEITIFEYNPD